MTTLIIARHGNTFESGETPRRVGARTDIPLTAKGREQAEKIGEYLLQEKVEIGRIVSSPLLRTMETAKISLLKCNINKEIEQLEFLREIDYGDDENKTDDDVISRVGREALDKWNNDATVPDGWIVDIEQIKNGWLKLAEQAQKDGGVTYAVTSNGIARFAPCILNDQTREEFLQHNKLKISTGAICIFKFNGEEWLVDKWNYKP